MTPRLACLIALAAVLGVGAQEASGSCSDDSECSQGQRCYQSFCRTGSGTACTVDATCPAGEICAVELGVCLTGCRAHCDCAQGSFCYKNTCLTDPESAVYCCANEGCPPGRWCFEPDGGKGTCAESEAYACQSACDCGPAHACIEKPGGGKVCVKDVDDPSYTGGEAILGLTIPDGEPTYCCSDPVCHGGRFAYQDKSAFHCFDLTLGAASNYCGGRPCITACDCDPGESCMDTRSEVVPPVGKACQVPSHCVSNAVAEAVYGASPADLLPCCGTGCLPGQKCEEGWRPGGTYTIERVVSVCGSCAVGNGVCDSFESAVTCPGDCSCGDGVCDTTEVWSGCPLDCGVCGDGTCNAQESPKTCPSDCQVVCGDGSCASSEVSSCPADCPCPDSSANWDTPVRCGDGVCQRQGKIPEDCKNCPSDCSATTDTDNDGTPDGCDLCPSDPSKSTPGVCGCGMSDVDEDADGIEDCVDECPGDPVNDPDKDGRCGTVDNCPYVANPTQADLDRDGIGDACDPDLDGDGVENALDACPSTTLGAIVGASGCSIDDVCPCGRQWANHGAYVSCVARTAQSFFTAGLISGAQKDAWVSAAARSVCGVRQR